jgi:nitrous oxide reductase accessory protein NosL
MMKKLLLLLLFTFAYSAQWCPICGNDLNMHSKTNHKAKLHNDRERHYCSLRCLAVDAQEYGIKDIQVRDFKTQTFIDANRSLYVIGSSHKGINSKVSKVAFSSFKDAKEFVKKHGGEIKGFKESQKIALSSLQEDNRFFAKIKTKKIYPKGKKIYEKKCKSFSIELSDFLEIDELKEYISQNKLCSHLNPKQFQALALYLWEQKRTSILQTIKERVVVAPDEKCPVCGMFTYKYPRWAAQIFFTHNGDEHHFSFDGVKDLMKFYFNPTKWGKYAYVNAKTITKIVVTDYYSQKAIDAKIAFYVIGSDIYGPMGHELIPFSSLEDAKSFKLDHRGTKIVQFNKISEAMVYKLDE